ncbi:hypothetical protein [Tsukamurella pulmonis]|uniref:hypothetical protein n=1 Tax=Tsukamurella pulmonis TaxID=47312 RepID=UPI000E0912CC|nr:hypothetical protein [Tsukamurella pulmonis]RDH13678.1 hypothetical protein DVB88_01200 [Tsukamurella pulmonis]
MKITEQIHHGDEQLERTVEFPDALAPIEIVQELLTTSPYHYAMPDPDRAGSYAAALHTTGQFTHAWSRFWKV